MSFPLVDTILSAAAPPSYRVGLWQAKAYRILKQHTNTLLLEKFGITTVAWALLGCLYDTPSPIRLSDLAEELGVEGAFITGLITTLEKKKLLTCTVPKIDRRSKIVALAPEGKKFVVAAEKIVRSQTKTLITGVAPRDLLGYITVLKAVIKNGQQLKKST